MHGIKMNEANEQMTNRRMDGWMKIMRKKKEKSPVELSGRIYLDREEK